MNFKKHIDTDKNLKLIESQIINIDDIVKNYKRVTPGQVNEIADTYFNKGGSK